MTIKSVLLVTEAFEVGGLETHIRGEINELSKYGCKVHLVCGRRFREDLIPSSIASVSSGLALGPDATMKDLVNTVEALDSLIVEHNVQVVHAHPFTSMFPALIASEKRQLPCVLSLHGPASLGDCYGPYYDFLLRSVILPGASMVIAVSEEVRSLALPYVSANRVVLLPNAVAVNDYPVCDFRSPFDAPWLVVSRLDAFKVKGIIEFIRYSRRAGIKGIKITGDGPARTSLEDMLRNEGLQNYVDFLGFRTDITNLMHDCSGVAGMGRVVLESLACGKPVCLIGYDGVKGLVDKQLFDRAARFNFSGRNLPNIDLETFMAQLAYVGKSSVIAGRDWLIPDHEEGFVWRNFLMFCNSVPVCKPSIATDIYAWIVSNYEQDQFPYLLSDNLFRQTGKLVHSKMHSDHKIISSFLFYELLRDDHKFQMMNKILAERDEQIASLNQALAERDGQIADLNQTVAERDEKIASLKQALAERDAQVSSLQKQIQDIWSSTSWRITRPLRFFKNLVRDPERTTYSLLKHIYWMLPGSLQQRLNGLRHAVIRFYLSRRKNCACASVEHEGTGDLSWEEFQDKVLSNLQKIKPFFGVRRPHGKRRVAILTNQLLDWNNGRPCFGGGERYALELARLLKELSFEVVFFQPSLQSKAGGEYYSFEVRFLRISDSVGEFHCGVCSEFTELTVDFDHVYYHLPEYASGTVREDGLMTCHGIWFDHNNYPNSIFRTPDWFKQLYQAFRNPLGIVSVDTNSIGVIRSLWPDMAQKMHFIPNFYDARFYYPDAAKRNPDRLTILFPRRSQINRGSRIFADIVSRIPHDVQILWVGEGDPVDTQIIKDVCSRDKRISFKVADFDQMPSWYQRADIAVIPTIACEGTSLSCIEALACGCAVIATNVGGLPDVVYDEINGLLVDPDPSAIANAINRLVEDRALRERLQRSGAETATKFELRKWRARWVELLRGYGWISDENCSEWLRRNAPSALVTHPTKSEKWIILTRNAIHGGVESLIREEAKLLNAPVIVCGGHDKKDTCPFEYSRADDARSLEGVIADYDVILYHWLPDWALKVIKKSKKTCIEFVHRTDTAASDKTVPTALVTHSAFLANYVYETYGRLCRVVDHPVAIDRFIPEVQLGRCVGAITSYYETKGIDIFLRAWAMLKDEFLDVPVRFYGAGDDLHRFKKLARELNIQVDFRDATSEPWLAMKDFRCFVVPSRIEGLPVAILEALAMNVPVVASALPGMVEFNALSKKRGYEEFINLALPENPDDLARVIRAVLKSDARRNSNAYICEYYSPQKHCSDLRSVLREVRRH